MGLIYPVHAHVADDEDNGYDDFYAEWSDSWLVEIDPEDDEDDPVKVGPLGPRAAWDLANEVEDLRPGWTVAIVPVFEPEPAESLVARIEET